MAASLWTCGCGTRSAAVACPECGWDRHAPGQPDQGHRRWASLAAGVIVAVLATDLVVAARAFDGPSITLASDGPDAPVDLSARFERPRVLPADLAVLLPPVDRKSVV